MHQRVAWHCKEARLATKNNEHIESSLYIHKQSVGTESTERTHAWSKGNTNISFDKVVRASDYQRKNRQI